MESINKKLKNRIMRRVYLRFFVRKVFAPTPVKLYIVASFVGFIVSRVSIGNVIENTPQVFNIGAFYNFSVSAFMNTEFVIQVLSVGVIIATFLLVRDLTKYQVGSFAFR